MKKWYKITEDTYINLELISFISKDESGGVAFVCDGVETYMNQEEGEDMYNAWHDFTFPTRKPKTDNTDEKFEDFWKTYKGFRSSCGSKKTARNYWDKLSMEDRDEAARLLRHYAMSVSDYSYMKHAERYLRDRVWEGVNEQSGLSFQSKAPEFYRAQG
jgi:hypothetical protein